MQHSHKQHIPKGRRGEGSLSRGANLFSPAPHTPQQHSNSLQRSIVPHTYTFILTNFSLMDKAVESLNYQLDDLQVDETFRFSVVDISEENVPPTYFITCNNLISKLSSYDDRLPQSKSFENLYQILEILSHRRLHFDFSSSHLAYRILHYLCTAIQSARLRKHASKSETRLEIAAERGVVLFQLDKVFRDLTISIDENADESSSVVQVLSTIRTIIQKNPRAATILQSPPRLLRHDVSMMLAHADPIDPRIQELNRINEAMFNDFYLRRRMLMKRFGVTIQSFLWGQRAVGKEGEIVAAIEAQQRHLSERPVRYSLADAWDAPVSLAHELSRRVTDSGGRRSLVKSVIIGAVPDRGGRANEMRPKASDIRPNCSNSSARGGGKGPGHWVGRNSKGGGGGRGGRGEVGGQHHAKKPRLDNPSQSQTGTAGKNGSGVIHGRTVTLC